MKGVEQSLSEHVYRLEQQMELNDKDTKKHLANIFEKQQKMEENMKDMEKKSEQNDKDMREKMRDIETTLSSHLDLLKKTAQHQGVQN